jgi:hypothetical protein
MMSLAELKNASLEQARALWAELYKRPAPRSLRRAMLVRALAYKIQADAAGDLPEPLKKELRTIARAKPKGKAGTACAAPAFRPGTRIVRVWRGDLYEVTAVQNGFEWQGRSYRSLSEIAREITGTRWNGLTFFGLRSPATKPQTKALVHG